MRGGSNQLVVQGAKSYWKDQFGVEGYIEIPRKGIIMYKKKYFILYYPQCFSICTPETLYIIVYQISFNTTVLEGRSQIYNIGRCWGLKT